MPEMVHLSGELALFTRPEFSAEPISYEVPPHSQIRGIMESIYWKPEMFYSINRIEILSPIRWRNIYRNELKSFNSRSASIDAASRRTQRMSTLLKNVEYIVHFSVNLTDKGEAEGETLGKHYSIVKGRLKKGIAHGDHPHFGRREYQANFCLVDDRSTFPEPAHINLDMGIMLYDRHDYMKRYAPGNVNLFCRARIRDGILDYPTYDQVLSEGIMIGEIK
jgi:CRISPR-associated protein Cas5 subtype I-C